jgi:hypothetical protein
MIWLHILRATLSTQLPLFAGCQNGWDFCSSTADQYPCPVYRDCMQPPHGRKLGGPRPRFQRLSDERAPFTTISRGVFQDFVLQSEFMSTGRQFCNVAFVYSGLKEAPTVTA